MKQFCKSKVSKLQQELQTQNQVSHNPKSKFEFLKGFIPILGSEWSFAQFRVLDTKCKVSFVPDEHQLIVISYEGKYSTCKNMFVR